MLISISSVSNVLFPKSVMAMMSEITLLCTLVAKKILWVISSVNGLIVLFQVLLTFAPSSSLDFTSCPYRTYL